MLSMNTLFLIKGRYIIGTVSIKDTNVITED